ncbi:MAG: enoyl-CoA hydratase/isomerase family protein [Dehalococcoidia bacterium]|nr:MAG: enoyl-CoA hydratase/isomerase family protein [Dehalococcoidia bacterium]
MPYNAVILEKNDMLATITLNKPDVNNAFDLPMMEEVDDAINDVSRDTDVRVVIITGAGKAFCTGGDVTYLQTLIEDRACIARTVIGDVVRRTGTMLTVSLKIRNMMKPVIAAVNGIAAGGGMGLALACDMRIMSDKARFSTIFIKRGVIPDCAATYNLPRLVGMAKACELVLRGNIIDAAEAERIGLINRIVPHDELMDATRELAAEIAKNPPIAVGLAKASLYKGMLETDMGSQMDYEAYIQNALMATEDFQEGINSFLEKREPVFKGK